MTSCKCSDAYECPHSCWHCHQDRGDGCEPWCHIRPFEEDTCVGCPGCGGPDCAQVTADERARFLASLQVDLTDGQREWLRHWSSSEQAGAAGDPGCHGEPTSAPWNGWHGPCTEPCGDPGCGAILDELPTTEERQDVDAVQSTIGVQSAGVAGRIRRAVSRRRERRRGHRKGD